MDHRAFFFFALLGAATTVEAAEPRTAPALDYDACMALARSDGEQATERALAAARDLAAAGQPLAGDHCRATMLLTAKNYAAAAKLLEKLARTGGPAASAEQAALWAQAGNAWSLAAEYPRAIVAFSHAQLLAPEDMETRLDLAIARAGAGQYDTAIKDLTAVLEANPDRVEALILRAVAWRHVGEFGKALTDLERALAIEPANPDALLESGVIHQLMGADDMARANWRRVLQVAPGSEAAHAAEENLRRGDAAADDGAER
jgi:tetratricopeptide (TPR) repeat protein